MTDVNEPEDLNDEAEEVEVTTTFRITAFAVLVVILWLVVAGATIWISILDLHRNPTADLSGEVIVGVFVASVGTAFLAKVLL